MQENLRFLRKTTIGCFAILLGILLCSVVSVAGIDVLCHNDIEKKLPLYPQSVVVSEKSGFFRPRAMGKSTITLSTSDATNVVRDWYSDYRLELEKASYDERTGRRMTPQGLANVSFSVEKDPDSGNTLIYLMSDCAYN